MRHRISASEARLIAADFGFPLTVDFHTLSTDQVLAVLDAANDNRYRKPRNANGSRARYFFAYLQRATMGDHNMTFHERQQAERRATALTEWRQLERRAQVRRACDVARVNGWLARYHAAREQVR